MSQDDEGANHDSPETVDVGLVSGGHSHENCITWQEKSLVRQMLAAYVATNGPLSEAPPYGTRTSPPKWSFYPQAGSLNNDLALNNYVDRDPLTGAIRDFACGGATYDGHQGHDSLIRGFEAMDLGVPIYAGADGVVVATNDGFPDRNICSSRCPPANFVVVDHGLGRIALYWHMKNGSVAVSVGDDVAAGQQLGLTGSSGYSTYPHLHLELIDSGVLRDPFTGACNTGESGWTQQPVLPASARIMDFATSYQNPVSVPTHELPHSGQIAVTDTLYISYNLLAVPASSSRRVRIFRPAGTVAYDSGTTGFGNTTFVTAGSYYRSIPVTFTGANSVLGTWRVRLDVNGFTLVDAPFELRTTRTADFNRAPSPVMAVFDPAAPGAGDVLRAQVIADPVLDDLDYDIVRHRFEWKVNGTSVRDVTIAATSDMLRRDLVLEGDMVTCDITPTDGRADAPTVTLSAVIGPTAAPSVTDWNGNGESDADDIAMGRSTDANGNAIPDECEQDVLYVHASATGHSTGLSWTDAFTDLQSALNVANANPLGKPLQVWVAAGIYKPAAAGDRTRPFALPRDRQILGGFVGSETEPDARDPEANLCVLSGDLAGDDGPNFTNRSDNALHVVDASGTSGAAILDGFTISGGNANTVLGHGRVGGGLYAWSGDIVIRRCRFTDNQGGSTTRGGGAGAYFFFCSNPQIVSCEFNHNQATNVAGGLGIEGDNSSMLLTDTSFYGNTANYGAAIYSNQHAVMTGINLSFMEHTAIEGGAVLSEFFATSNFINCVFDRNSVTSSGGAVELYDNAAANFTNCTLVRNSATSIGGAISALYSSPVTIQNSILSNNSAPNGSNIFSGLISTGNPIPSVTVRYSDIVGGQGSIFRQNGTTLVYGPGNISADPQFVNLAGGDLRLSEGSPAIDAANNTLLTPEIMTDMGGLARFVDDPAAVDSGVSGGSGGSMIADMGAYERQIAPCYADFNQDGGIDGADVEAFYADWEAGFVAADVNQDGGIDGADVETFFAAWEAGAC